MPLLLDSIAVLDLEGPGMIIDTSERESEAHRRVQSKIAHLENPPALHSTEYNALFYTRSALYDPSLLQRDRLNPGVDRALARLRTIYTDIYVVTGRPHFLQEPTMIWLREHGIYLSDEEVRFKLHELGENKRERWVPVAIWKGIVVCEARRRYKEVLFVDNEKDNRLAIAALELSGITIKDTLAEYIY